MSKKDKEVKKKEANREEHDAKTSLGCKFYSIAFLAAVGMIVLYTAITYLSGFGEFLSKFANKLIEYLAAGLLPAIVVAFVTDLANTKRQKEMYKDFCEESTRTLRTMCEVLPLELYGCLLDIDREKVGTREETFITWCEELYGTKDAWQIKYFAQGIKEIGLEAQKALHRFDSYQGSQGKKEREKLNALIKSCKGFYTIVRRGGKEVNEYHAAPKKFADAVLELFPEDLEENADINSKYRNKFGCDNYDECEPQCNNNTNKEERK